MNKPILFKIFLKIITVEPKVHLASSPFALVLSGLMSFFGVDPFNVFIQMFWCMTLLFAFDYHTGVKANKQELQEKFEYLSSRGLDSVYKIITALICFWLLYAVEATAIEKGELVIASVSNYSKYVLFALWVLWTLKSIGENRLKIFPNQPPHRFFLLIDTILALVEVQVLDRISNFFKKQAHEK